MSARKFITVLYALVLATLMAPAAPASAATKLTNNVTHGLIWDFEGNRQHFYIDVPNNASSLVIKTWAGVGNANLYVRRGNTPTLSNYDRHNTSNNNDATITINSPAAGRWYVMVYAKTFFWGMNLNAKFTLNTPPPPPPPQVWTFTGLNATTGNYLLYWVDVPAGKSSLRIETSGGAGDASLLYRFGAEPTWNTYDIQQQAPLSNYEWINLSSPTAGRHYFWVLAAYSFSGVTLKVTLQ